MVDMSEYQISNVGGLIVESDCIKLHLTDFPCPQFGYTYSDGKLTVVYEETDGSLVCALEKNGFQKEPILLSKRQIYTKKEIRIEYIGKELHLFFSSYYKGKKLILHYQKSQGLHVFDCCDDASFQTLLRFDGSILVLYQKGGEWGCNSVSEGLFGEFWKIGIKHPVKLLELLGEVYLLYGEKGYFLYRFQTNEHIRLPLVEYKKPFIYEEDGGIYVKYRWKHRTVYYQITDGKAVFLKEIY